VVGLVALLALLAWSPVSCQMGQTNTTCECGAPPRCGETCTAACGCCSVGPPSCSQDGIVRSNPSADCYDLIPCSAPDRCVDALAGPVCAESAIDCEAVRSAYEAHLQRSSATTLRTGEDPLAAGSYRNIQCPESCKVSAGHCAQGLDTCWFISYGPDLELDRIAALYESLACPAMGLCRCPPAPEANCQFESTGASGASRGPLTCMIQ
jgi:hypothetical protein